tara:strand:+ start:490 stop:1143 length:654 start_codon:yes stop_codon:yes gene_type:complete
MSDGIAYPLPQLALHTGATGYGSLPSHSIPTPTASDHIERKSTSTEVLNPNTNKSVSLDRFVKYWPTPTTQDNAQVRGQGKAVGNKRGTTLGGAVRMWPTPTAMTGGQGVAPSHKEGGHGWNIGAAVQDSLSDDPVRVWPTPRASEWKGVGPIGSKSHQYRLDRKYLDATVQEAEQRTGRLNPNWVEWLMGWPIGWTALEPVETDRLAEWLQSHGGY